MEHQDLPEEPGLDPLVWVPRTLLEQMFRMEGAALRVMLFLCLAEQSVHQPPATLPRSLIAAGSGVGESRVQQALEVWERQGWVERAPGEEWRLTIRATEPTHPLEGPLRGEAVKEREDDGEDGGV